MGSTRATIWRIVVIEVKSSLPVEITAGCACTRGICLTCGVGAQEAKINAARTEIRKII
jgi:hypothetical protein